MTLKSYATTEIMTNLKVPTTLSDEKLVIALYGRRFEHCFIARN